MAARSRAAGGPKPPEPGVIMSMTEPAGALNAPLLGKLRRAVRRRQRDGSRRSGLAAEQAERRRGHALHAQRADRIRAVEQPPGPDRAAAAAITSGAAGVRVDLIALDAHGKRHLQHLDRRVHGVGDAAGDRVDAVLVRPRAEAALDRLVGDVLPPVARIDAAEREDRRGALAAGHHLLRHEARERAHHHVGDAMRYLVVGVDDGRGKRGVHHRALGRPDLDRAPAAGVGRNQIVRVDRGLEAAVDARGGDRERRIHRPFDLRRRCRRSRRPAGRPVFLTRQANAERRIVAVRVVGDAVAVAEILERAFAIGQVHERRAHQPLRIVHDLAPCSRRARRAP